jgi:AraC-like DNA-binding protein
MDRLQLNYTVNSLGNVQFHEPVPADTYQKLVAELEKYGIEIVDNHRAIMVQKIKEAIMEMLDYSTNMPMVKISSYLSEKIGENYRTLSQVFSEVCHISIENFIIIRRIEIVKQLLVNENLSLTEISYRLHYSSVAHLSNQFKKITGLTSSSFQKIVHHKRASSNAYLKN